MNVTFSLCEMQFYTECATLFITQKMCSGEVYPRYLELQKPMKKINIERVCCGAFWIADIQVTLVNAGVNVKNGRKWPLSDGEVKNKIQNSSAVSYPEYSDGPSLKHRNLRSCRIFI